MNCPGNSNNAVARHASFAQINCYYCEQITPTNHLLTALAIADLLTMLSYLPYAVYFYCITVPDPSYGHPAGWVAYLLFNVYFTITTHTAAMWLTVALAVFRYVVVCCHQVYGARLCTLQRAKVSLICLRLSLNFNLHEIWSVDSKENHSNCCHRISHFKAEMLRI